MAVQFNPFGGGLMPAAGPAGADGKTILSGVANPTTEGTDGDLFLNTFSGQIFKKISGDWISQIPSIIGGGSIRLTAGENLGGQRIVALGADGRAVYADYTNTAHASKVLGLTNSSVLENETVLILMAGEVSDSGWSWAPGVLLYLGANSLLTTNPPGSGFVKIMGATLAATKINLQSQPTIQLT
jgi:hypothetical protein